MAEKYKDIGDIIRNGPECGVEAMARGNKAYLKHMKECVYCRRPYLINNIMPNDVEVYLSSLQ
jgi:hypothetical protein